MTLTKTKPHKPSKAERQRVGHHHQHSNHYIKTYWPYLPMLAIISAGFVANNWLGNLHKNVLGYATDMSVSSLLTDTNQVRSAHGSSQLHLNAQLDQAAQAKANDMAARNYWSHITPDGTTPWSFITASQYTYESAGENLAYGFTGASSVITGWMNSPEHRANLLGDYKDVGFGIANIPNFQHNGPETLVVAMYASPATTEAATLGASTHTSEAPVLDHSSSRHVARVQLASGSSAWGVILVSLLGLAGFALVVPRHSFAWRKALVRGERFVLKHPLLDIIGVSLVAASIILTHTAGIIR
jgi:uncharacterized protein YkwD